MKIKVFKIHPEAKIPRYAHPGDAGLDLYANEDKVLKPGERHKFALGFKTEIPEGYVALVWDKSGLADKYGLHCLGGVIDAGYRGEYQIVLYNSGNQEYQINKGDKIAQLLIQPVASVEIEAADDL